MLLELGVPEGYTWTETLEVTRVFRAWCESLMCHGVVQDHSSKLVLDQRFTSVPPHRHAMLFGYAVKIGDTFLPLTWSLRSEFQVARKAATIRRMERYSELLYFIVAPVLTRLYSVRRSSHVTHLLPALKLLEVRKWLCEYVHCMV